MHLVTRPEPVAVAPMSVCAVLAASRGYARWCGGPVAICGPPWTRLRSAQGWPLGDGVELTARGANAPAVIR
jgi:hypothetical protein